MNAASIAEKLQAKRNGSCWMAHCPAHDDTNASLSISEGKDGRVLLNCHAGCDFQAVVRAAGLKVADLFPDNRLPRPARRKTKDRQIVATYDYTDELDNLLFQVVRFNPKGFRQRRPDPNKSDEWVWSIAGCRRVLYRLPSVRQAVADGKPVFVVEGERDVHALEDLGVSATCNPGGAGKWRDEYSDVLKDAAVGVIADRDAPGIKHAQAVARSLYGKARMVFVMEYPDRDGQKVKDAADWVAAGGTHQELFEIVRAAPEWEPENNQSTSTTSQSPIEAARNGEPYAMTDLGNAERLAVYHGQNIRFDTVRRQWRIWDGRRWALDSALKVNSWAADTARRIRSEAAAAPPSNGNGADLGQLLFGHAVKSESRDRLSAMIDVCKAQPGIAADADSWDSNPMLFNCANGTIDLRTGELRPHNRADGLTKLSPVEYRPGERCARLNRFLEDATEGDSDLSSFLQVVTGYTLTGLTNEEILLLIYGPENAGKTTYLETLRAVLGDYSVTINPEMLLKQKTASGGGATPDIARLMGARLAAGSEMEEGRTLAEALAKNMTGGESICARHLYADTFEFLPQFKLWLAVNHCPKVSADDGAIWRRILRIGFPHTVPPEKRDKTLKAHLRKIEGGAPAFLAWAVEGCLRWQSEGLDVPEAVRKSTAAYRNESDPLATFFEDCLSFNPQAWTLWAELWAAYCEHASEQGTTEKYRCSPRRIQERLTRHNCETERRYIGRGWRGVELRPEWKHDGHDGYDTTLQSFSTREKARKTLHTTDISDMSDMPRAEIEYMELPL